MFRIRGGGYGVLLSLAVVALPLTLMWLNARQPQAGSTARDGIDGTAAEGSASAPAATVGAGTTSRGLELDNPTSAQQQQMQQPQVQVQQRAGAAAAEGGLKVVCISDLHGLFRRHKDLIDIPPGDVLVFAGDAELATPDDIVEFEGFLLSLPHKHKVFTYGNMDIAVFPGHLREVVQGGTPTVDKVVSVAGLRVLGSPWSPRILRTDALGGGFDAFSLYDADAQFQHWVKVLPYDTEIDILITHTPPYGYGDVVKGAHMGDEELLKAVQRMRKPPKLWVCGHIHEGYGEYRVPHKAAPDGILLINAAVREVTTPGHEQGTQPRVVQLPEGRVVGQGVPPPRRKLQEADLWKPDLGRIAI